MADIEVINEINKLKKIPMAAFSSGYFLDLERCESRHYFSNGYATDDDNNIIKIAFSVSENSFLKIPFFDQFALICKLLKRLKHLQTLKINNTYGLNLKHIIQLTQLSELDLTGCCIMDIDPLGEMKQLINLNLKENLIKDISSLGNLQQLKVLDLSQNRIMNISPLTKLWSLKELNLRDNRISHIEVLNKFNSLEKLDLSYNPISDINPLKELVQFNKVIVGPLKYLAEYSENTPFFLEDLNLIQYNPHRWYDNRIFFESEVEDENKLNFGLPPDTLPYAYHCWKRNKFPYFYRNNAIDWVLKAIKSKYDNRHHVIGLLHEKHPLEFNRSIKLLNKAIKLSPKYFEAWKTKVLMLVDQRKYTEALDCLDEMRRFTQTPFVYNKTADLLAYLGYYDEAIDCYRMLKYKRNYHEQSLLGEAYCLFLSGQYEKSIKCYNEWVKWMRGRVDLLPYYSDNDLIYEHHYGIFTMLAMAHAALKQHEKSIEYYDKFLKIKFEHSFFINKDLPNQHNLAYIYKNKFYDKSFILNQKGISLYNLCKYEEALNCFEESLEIDPDFTDAKNNKGMVLCKLFRYTDAVLCFLETNIDILNVMVNYDCQNCEEVLNALLDYDSFFQDITLKIDNENKKYYKNIYIQSLQIISLLYVNRPEERKVAHYTSISTSKKLLFENSKFRLSPVRKSNDPTEGLKLLGYLRGEDIFLYWVDIYNYEAFAGCFTFNFDNLNQFRLYAKEDGQEATGVSLIIRNSFFSLNAKRTIPSLFNDSDIDKSIAKYFGEVPLLDEKLPLFRCIYVDVKSKKIISLGHKEEYLFFREGNDTGFADYKKYIENTINDIQVRLDKLQNSIKNEKNDIDIRDTLLLNLRYLTKDFSFKEEQECRIIKIEHKDRSNIHKNKGHLYFNYLDMKRYIDRIYYAPKAFKLGDKNLKKYEDLLRKKSLRIYCIQSDSNFR